jgi:GntR family histidine utilization transcriptional repressor
MSKSLEPAYLTIKNDFLRRIREGELRPGDKIDHEEVIAQQYDCARATVHRAIRELAEEGFVERKRRAGTRIASAGTRATKVTIPLVRQEIESRGATYRFSLLAREMQTLPEMVAHALGLAIDDEALYLRTVHFANDKPFQLEDRWVNTKLVPSAIDAKFDEFNPNEWLVKTVPYSEAEHYFSAENADGDTAKLLQIGVNDAVFVIERRTSLPAGGVTYVRLQHPGDNYKMAAKNFSFSTKN